MRRTGIPFLVGGGYALKHYAGGVRGTKDLDVFVRRRDAVRLLRALAADGFDTDLTFPHWLGKARVDGTCIDIGHAHHGRFEGRTRSDVPVYNVCIPVLERVNPGHPPYWTVDLDPAASPSAVARRLRAV